MADNTNISLTVEAWAEIVVKTWLEKIIMLKINYSHDLYNSFAHHVITNANGDPDRIEFAFLYYGKFVDMGVGREFSRGNSGNIGFTPKRKPKPWYSKEFYHQLQILRELLAEKYAMKASQVIMVNLESFDVDSSLVNSHSPKSTPNNNPTARAYDKARGRGY